MGNSEKDEELDALIAKIIESIEADTGANVENFPVHKNPTEKIKPRLMPSDIENVVLSYKKNEIDCSDILQIAPIQRIPPYRYHPLIDQVRPAHKSTLLYTIDYVRCNPQNHLKKNTQKLEELMALLQKSESGVAEVSALQTMIRKSGESEENEKIRVYQTSLQGADSVRIKDLVSETNQEPRELLSFTMAEAEYYRALKQLLTTHQRGFFYSDSWRCILLPETIRRTFRINNQPEEFKVSRVCNRGGTSTIYYVFFDNPVRSPNNPEIEEQFMVMKQFNDRMTYGSAIQMIKKATELCPQDENRFIKVYPQLHPEHDETYEETAYLTDLVMTPPQDSVVKLFKALMLTFKTYERAGYFPTDLGGNIKELFPTTQAKEHQATGSPIDIDPTGIWCKPYDTYDVTKLGKCYQKFAYYPIALLQGFNPEEYPIAPFCAHLLREVALDLLMPKTQEGEKTNPYDRSAYIQQVNNAIDSIEKLKLQEQDDSLEKRREVMERVYAYERLIKKEGSISQTVFSILHRHYPKSSLYEKSVAARFIESADRMYSQFDREARLSKLNNNSPEYNSLLQNQMTGLSNMISQYYEEIKTIDMHDVKTSQTTTLDKITPVEKLKIQFQRIVIGTGEGTGYLERLQEIYSKVISIVAQDQEWDLSLIRELETIQRGLSVFESLRSTNISCYLRDNEITATGKLEFRNKQQHCKNGSVVVQENDEKHQSDVPIINEHIPLADKIITFDNFKQQADRYIHSLINLRDVYRSCRRGSVWYEYKTYSCRELLEHMITKSYQEQKRAVQIRMTLEKITGSMYLEENLSVQEHLSYENPTGTLDLMEKIIKRVEGSVPESLRSNRKTNMELGILHASEAEYVQYIAQLQHNSIISVKPLLERYCAEYQGLKKDPEQVWITGNGIERKALVKTKIVYMHVVRDVYYELKNQQSRQIAQPLLSRTNV